MKEAGSHVCNSHKYAEACGPWFDPAHPMNAVASRRSTIDELEAILMRDDEEAIEILPNGEIRHIGSGEIPKPLTMRENLGGEYAGAP